MKKIVLVAIVALAGSIFLPSCKKDYTCSCSYLDANGQQQTTEVSMPKAKKKDAKSACDELTSTYMSFTNVQCTLK